MLMSSPAERRNSGFMPVQEAGKAMDKENTELANCNFSQTCSRPCTQEYHESRYGGSLIQTLLDFMHIRSALSADMDRENIEKVDREFIRFFFDKVRKDMDRFEGRDRSELQANPLIREILLEQDDLEDGARKPAPYSSSFYTVLAKLWMDYLGAAADGQGRINLCERRHFYSLSCLSRLARCAADNYLS